MCTMKLSYVLFVFLSLIVGSFPVSADRMITFYFGNSSTGLSCTENDKMLMAPIFNISYYKVQRQLRSVSSSNTASSVADGFPDRGLTTKARICAKRCQGYAGSFCHPMPICSANRRSLQNTFNPLYATCPDHVAEVNRRLNALIATDTALSADCKELIRADNRNATCEDCIIVGEIASFTIVRMTEQNMRCIGYPPSHCLAKPPPPPLAVTSNEIIVKLGSKYLNVDVRLIPCITTLELSVVGPGINSKRIITGSTSLQAFALTQYTMLTSGKYNVTAIPNNELRAAKSFKMTIS